MNDTEIKIKQRVWVALLNRFLEGGPQDAEGWDSVLRSCGCEALPWGDCADDNEEEIFVRDTAMGNIRVPCEVAFKILALGRLP